MTREPGKTRMGKHVRTPEMNERNRLAQIGREHRKCTDDCACGKHAPHPGRGGRKCEEGCKCGRHERSFEHRVNLSEASKRYWNRKLIFADVKERKPTVENKAWMQDLLEGEEL